jgi:hypothetical protein
MGLLKRGFQEESGVPEVPESFDDVLVMPEVVMQAEPEPEPKMEEIPETELSEAETESYLIECCERIMEETNQLREEKTEYDLLTGQLNDSQFLSELEDVQKEPLVDTASQIILADKQRRKYQEKVKRISDARMAQFGREDPEEIPEMIRRLKANETYQSAVKHDMQKLEGEKNEWTYLIEEINEQRGVLKKLAILAFAVFAICVVGMVVMTAVLDIDVSLVGTIIGFICLLFAFGVYVKMTLNDKKCRQAQANTNRAIVLLNQMKAKYVSITNAVEFTYLKYNVKTSQELTYIWEEYMNAKRERESLDRINDETAHYERKLLRLLQQYSLNDAKMWVYRAEALAEPDEMDEVRQELLEKRQKIRSKMEVHVSHIRSERERIAGYTVPDREMRSEIREILDSIEKICGAYE